MTVQLIQQILVLGPGRQRLRNHQCKPQYPRGCFGSLRGVHLLRDATRQNWNGSKVGSIRLALEHQSVAHNAQRTRTLGPEKVLQQVRRRTVERGI